MQSGEKRLYAIGMKGGWVEVRSAHSPPRLHHSKVKTEVEQEERFYETPFTYTAQYRTVKKPRILQQSTYTGGHVLTTIKARTFSRVCKVSVHPGGIMELSEHLVNLLTEKGLLYVKKSTYLPPPTEEAPHQEATREAPPTYPGTVTVTTGGIGGPFTSDTVRDYYARLIRRIQDEVGARTDSAILQPPSTQEAETHE